MNEAVKVLICDDESIVRTLLHRRLTTASPGWVFEEASSFQEIKEKTESFQPDIYLLDLQYPDAGEDEVLALIPGLLQRPNHPHIIIISGLSDSRERAAELKIDFQDKNEIADSLNKLWQNHEAQLKVEHTIAAINPGSVSPASLF